MNVSKEEIYILYKTDNLSQEKVVKGFYKSAVKAYNFKKYLEKRNRIKLTKGETVSLYEVQKARIYIDFSD